MKALIVNDTEYEFQDDGTADHLLATGAIERCNSDGGNFTANEIAEVGEEEEDDDDDGGEDFYYRLVPGRTFAISEVEKLIEAT